MHCCNALPDVPLPCFALPCPAMPCPALPCPALPCLALPCPCPCLASSSFHLPCLALPNAPKAKEQVRVQVAQALGIKLPTARGVKKRKAATTHSAEPDQATIKGATRAQASVDQAADNAKAAAPAIKRRRQAAPRQQPLPGVLAACKVDAAWTECTCDIMNMRFQPCKTLRQCKKHTP